MKNNENNFTPRNISSAEVVSFFAAKNVSPDCPACGNGNSSIQAESTETLRLSYTEFANIVDGKITRSNNFIHPSIMAVCNNCGYIRYFSVHKILMWLDQDKSNVEGQK
jgi:predicted nucleic-acid-binding Zn-ribbon protein